ncbi:MAG TPA: oligosaccharide flippase family protein [Solirubrobacteraceae bacterium]|nr:oligosaccharide flippase family protein [Solirubrobacteraceae bacterium]
MVTEPDPAVPVAATSDLLDTAEAGPTAIRGSALRTGGYLAGALLSVVAVPLLNRHLGFDDYGRYVLVISLVTIVQGVTDVGLGQIGVREFATRGPEAQHALIRNLLGLRIALTSAGVLLATAFAAIAGYGHAVLLGTLLAGVGMVLTVLQGTYAVPLAARLELGWVTLLDLLRQVLGVVGIVVLVLAGANLLPFLALFVPVSVVVLAATMPLVRRSAALRPSLERSEWVVLLRAVLPFAAAVAIGTVYLRITVVLMSLLTSSLQTGYYATSYVVVSVLIAVPALTVGSALPILARAARDDHERLGYVLERLFEVTLIVGVWLALALATGAGFIVHVLTNGRSGVPTEVLRIQSLAMITQFTASTFQYGLLSLHRHRELLMISIGALVASVALTFALVPVLDAQGAAIAFSAAEAVLAASSYAMLRRARPQLRYSSRVPLRVAAALVVGGGVALIPGLTSLLSALLGSVVYFAVLLALRAIPQELIDAALRRPQPLP